MKEAVEYLSECDLIDTYKNECIYHSSGISLEQAADIIRKVQIEAWNEAIKTATENMKLKMKSLIIQY